MGDVPDPTILLRACAVSYTASHAACKSHHGAFPVWIVLGLLSLRIFFLGPDSGADGHNEGELTNSVRKDGAERALRS